MQSIAVQTIEADGGRTLNVSEALKELDELRRQFQELQESNKRHRKEIDSMKKAQVGIVDLVKGKINVKHIIT